MATMVLLDTHAFVWAAASPRRLGRAAREIIENPRSELAVSAASAWEIATKVRLGKFPEAEPIVTGYIGILEQLRARSVAITADDALRAGSMRWDHRDPFDRMLAAQALNRNLTLISRDKAFLAVGALTVVW